MMNSLEKKLHIQQSNNNIIYKVKKIAPISLIKNTNKGRIKNKLTTLKSSYINGSTKISNNNNNNYSSSTSLISSKKNSKSKSHLNNSLNPSTISNQLIFQNKKTSSLTNRNLVSKRKPLTKVISFSHKTSNQNSLNKEKNKIENKVKMSLSNNKKNILRQNTQSCSKNISIKSRDNSLNNNNKKLSLKLRGNSTSHVTEFKSINSLSKNNVNLNKNINNSNNKSLRNERSNSFQNSLNKNKLIKRESSVSKKVSINILRERQNIIQKKKMYKSFLNQKKNVTLNVNLNKKFLEIEKIKVNESKKKILKYSNSSNRIYVNTENNKEKKKKEEKKKNKRNLLNLNIFSKENNCTNQYLKTYSNSISRDNINELSNDDIDNVLNANYNFENENIEDEEFDLNSIIKCINFDAIRVNAKSIFSYKFNKEHEFYTSIFNKNYEQNILRNSSSYYTLNTSSSTLTKRTKENSSSRSLGNNQIFKK